MIEAHPGFEEGAWYYANDGSKWKVKTVFGDLVLARRRWTPVTRAFRFDSQHDGIRSYETWIAPIVIRPEWRVRR